ncbi:MAG: hypothetical protein V2B20_12370 [Pseudomonadota bacterium]
MKKTKTSDELRMEYKREDLGVGVRGKYLEEYSKGSNLVLLSPEVAKVFTTAEAVNDALLSLINLAEKSTGRTSRSTGSRKKQTSR